MSFHYATRLGFGAGKVIDANVYWYRWRDWRGKKKKKKRVYGIANSFQRELHSKCTFEHDVFCRLPDKTSATPSPKTNEKLMDPDKKSMNICVRITHKRAETRLPFPFVWTHILSTPTPNGVACCHPPVLIRLQCLVGDHTLAKCLSW